MLLLCWNVAGWATTLSKIREHFGSLSAYLDRHGVDILCIQEAKLLASRVADEPRGVGAAEAGWHSAWALYKPPTAGGAGGANGRRRAAGTWNGCATWAREGLLCKADAEPLRDPELDAEGRCLRTDHGEFVLFNVYVPNSGPAYVNLPLKMRFLRALRAAMAAQRAAGRAVVLAGDMNLSRRPEDVPWRDRLLVLGRVFGDGGGGSGEQCEQQQLYALPAALAAKLRGWRDGVRGVLAALELVPAPGKGGGAGGSGSEADAHRVTWRAPDGRPLLLGREASRPLAQLRWGLLGQVSFPDPDDPSAPPLIARLADTLSVGRLADVITKALNAPFPETEQRALAVVAASSSPPCLVAWADSLLNEDGMVDSFAALRPHAQERFTCWNQYTNTRYENDGARIDYVFVDAPLFRDRALPGAPLSTGGTGGDPDTAAAALAAATAGGAWKMAPFDGSGIPEPTMTQLDTQFEPPNTGIRYMPPPYSDHAAVTLLLADVAPPPPPLPLTLDADTLRTMPHKQTRSIKTFFAPKAAAAAAGDAGGSGAAAPALVEDATPAAADSAAAVASAAAPAAPAAPAAASGGGKKRAAPPPPPPLPPGQKSMRDMFGGGRPKPPSS